MKYLCLLKNYIFCESIISEWLLFSFLMLTIIMCKLIIILPSPFLCTYYLTCITFPNSKFLLIFCYLIWRYNNLNNESIKVCHTKCSAKVYTNIIKLLVIGTNLYWCALATEEELIMSLGGVYTWPINPSVWAYIIILPLSRD